MGRRTVDLADRLCPETLQSLQDKLSCSVDVPLLLVDPRGRPFTVCEDLSGFCRHFTRAVPVSRPCMKCGTAGGTAEPVSASPWGLASQDFIQRCPLGLSHVAVPIWSTGESLGYLLTSQVCVSEASAPEFAGSDDYAALLARLPRRGERDLRRAAAGLVATGALIGELAAARRRNQRLAELNREQRRWIRENQRTDTATGLPNRSHLVAALEAEVVRARRYKRSLSLAVLDIDGFAGINEEFGYDIGEAVLRAVAQCLSGTLRQTDIVARIGPDEFAVLFPETARYEAMFALARVAGQVEDLNASGELPVEIRLTLGLSDDVTDAAGMLGSASAEAENFRRSGNSTALTPTRATNGGPADSAPR